MKITRAGVDRSTNYFPAELDAISIILAGWDGEVGQGTVPVPDPAGNQEPYEGEQLLLEQDSLTITDGFLGMVVSERGDSVTGTRRVHTMTLFDDNALLAGHATPGWARPAEAPAARWAAFVDDFLPGSIDTTWLLTTNESGITLPKKTYRTDSLFDDLSADTIGPTGKTVYIEHRRFHWHLPTEGQTCSLSIHDTTYNLSTSFFPTSPTRSKDGMDLRTKIYARNNAGVIVEVSDATAISRHEAAGLKHHGYSEYDTETAAEMTRDINVTLLERKQERITYGYTIGPLTAAQAVALIPGSQMTVTVGLHGLSGSVKRIARVTLAYHHGRVPYFTATVELGYPRRVKRKPTKQSSAADSTGGSGTEGSGGSHECGCPPWDFNTCTPARESFTRTVGSGGWGACEFTAGNWFAFVNGAAASVNGAQGVLSVTSTGITPGDTKQVAGPNLPAYPIHLRARVKPVGPKNGTLVIALGPATGFIGTGGFFVSVEETIGGSPNPLRVQANISGASGTSFSAFTYPLGITDPINQYLVIEMVMTATDLDFRVYLDGGAIPAYTTYSLTADAATLPDTLGVAVGGMTSDPGVTTWQVDLIEFLCGDPPTGTRIIDEYVGMGDGTRTTFRLQRPYRATTVRLEVDRIHQPVTETDVTTGDIDLGFAPIVGEKLTATYEAA